MLGGRPHWGAVWEADKYFRNLYETIKRGIKGSSFTEAEKNSLTKELESIFGDYFEK